MSPRRLLLLGLVSQAAAMAGVRGRRRVSPAARVLPRGSVAAGPGLGRGEHRRAGPGDERPRWGCCRSRPRGDGGGAPARARARGGAGAGLRGAGRARGRHRCGGGGVRRRSGGNASRGAWRAPGAAELAARHVEAALGAGARGDGARQLRAVVLGARGGARDVAAAPWLGGASALAPWTRSRGRPCSWAGWC